MASTVGKIVVTACAAALLAGCAGIKDHRGYVMDTELAQGIQVGIDNKESVTKTLGRPTFVGQFDGNDWYYLSANTKQVPFRSAKTIDQDELYYLQTIRQHIEASREPYYLRQGTLVQLSEQLNQMRLSQDRSQYPILAAALFLPGLEEAHEAMARDRARCEAYALALAEATGKPCPEYSVNPHHGRPYEVVRQSQRVVVNLGEPDERDVVIAVSGNRH